MDSSPADFPVLLARAKTGDAEAAGALLWPSRARVWGIAYRVVQRRHDAEDVVQEAFLRAFRSLGGMRATDRKGLEVWLVRITVNCARDALRASPATTAVGPADGPDDTMPFAEQTALNLRLQDLLRDLPFCQRSAVVLVDMYDFTRKETSRILGVPRGTVDSALFAGRAKLRKAWGEES